MSKRDDMENNAKAETGVGIAAGAGLLALLIGGIASSSSKKHQLEQINAEISEIDRRISDYKSKFLGSVLYSEEISNLENTRRQLVARRNELI